MHAQQGQWQSKTLANGMQVAYCQDSTRQLTHMGLTIRGGASLDPSDAQGLARLYENLFYQYLPDSTPATSAAEQGIFLSHKTLLESHFFGMSLPAAQLPAAMQLLKAGLTTTNWSDSTLGAAREALLPTLTAQDLTPESNLSADLIETLWQTFGSRKQIAGSYADILRLSSQRIIEAIAPYRHPANCMLSATGAAPSDSFFVAAEAQLGPWRDTNAGALLPKVPMPALTQRIYFQTVNEFASHPLILIAWPIDVNQEPAQTSRDAELFCKLAQLKQGRMHRHLVDSNLVRSFTWSWAGGLNPGQLLLYIIPETDRFAACMREIESEIAHLPEANYFTQEEVAITNRIIALQAAQTHDQSISRLLAHGHAWQLHPEANEDDASAQLKDIQSFVQSHLAQKPYVAGLLINSETALALNADSLFQPGKPVVVAAVNVDSPAKPSTVSMSPAALGKLRVLFMEAPLAPDTAGISTLQTLAELLRAQPKQRVYLNSFSEGEGEGVKNYQLSVSRAKAIRTWLEQQAGIPATQVVIRAYGEAFPEFPSETDLRNRRITFEYAPADAKDNAY